MNDVVTVTGRFWRTRTIGFVRKGKGVRSITGEKLYENRVIQAIAAMERELGLICGFYLLLADARGSVYQFVLECVGPLTIEHERIRSAVDRHLGDLARWVRDRSQEIDADPAAWCAIELAILDAHAKRERVPGESLLSLPPDRS